MTVFIVVLSLVCGFALAHIIARWSNPIWIRNRRLKRLASRLGEPLYAYRRPMESGEEKYLMIPESEALEGDKIGGRVIWPPEWSTQQQMEWFAKRIKPTHPEVDLTHGDELVPLNSARRHGPTDICLVSDQEAA